MKRWTAIGLIGAAFICAFMTSIHSSGPAGSVDFFGRRLVDAPAWARIFFWTGQSWPGAAWHAFDALVFFGLIWAAALLYKNGETDTAR